MSATGRRRRQRQRGFQWQKEAEDKAIQWEKTETTNKLIKQEETKFVEWEKIIKVIQERGPPATCSVCRKITLHIPQKDGRQFYGFEIEDAAEFLVDDPSVRMRGWFKIAKKGNLFVAPPNTIIFDVSVFEMQLEEYALEKCTFCSNIGSFWTTVYAGFSGYLAALFTEDGAWQFGLASIYALKDDNGYEIEYTLGFSPGFGGGKFFPAVDNASIASREISTRLWNQYPGSDRSHTMARKWLKDCVEGHENCSQPTGNIMPTRLLEVEHTQDQKHRRVRLCETYKLKVAPYAALSYCWGGTQPIMTTSENIKQHLTRIHYTELPATIQDAITITLSLGLRYIWIDSLCIIQNDNSDKLCEMGLMGSIYSQARVTISASRAVSVREGFLHDRAPLKSTMRSPILEYPYRCPNGEVTLVSLIHEAAIPDVQEKSWEPLSRRGWALQERLLSPRIIEYGSFQTRWICSHNDGIHSDGLQQGSQCVADHSKDPDTMFSRALALIQSGQNRPGGTQVTEPIAMPVYETWKDVVEHYTKRALTLSVDRLPAIAGVAMRFSRIVADEYCAGLWRSDLLAELLWRIEDPEEVVPRPQEYQGPSWSWAAVNDSITFMDYKQSRSQIEIGSVHITPVKSRLDNYEARFGQVDYGKLVLTGKLKPGLWMRPPGGGSLSQIYQKVDGAGSYAGVPIHMWPDAREPEFDNTDTTQIPVLLLMFNESKGQNLHIINSTGLVLRRENGSEYSRLGVFVATEWRGDGKSKYEDDLPQKQVACLSNWDVQTITLL